MPTHTPEDRPPHERLPVWQAALRFADAVYSLSGTFPADERFGLVTQLRRAAVSVLANIAEGWARVGSRGTLAFLDIAYGSLREAEALTAFARFRGLGDEVEHESAMVSSRDCGKQLLALIRAMRKKR